MRRHMAVVVHQLPAIHPRPADGCVEVLILWIITRTLWKDVLPQQCNSGLGREPSPSNFQLCTMLSGAKHRWSSRRWSRYACALLVVATEHKVGLIPLEILVHAMIKQLLSTSRQAGPLPSSHLQFSPKKITQAGASKEDEVN